MSKHSEVTRFPDNYVFSEPQFIADIDIPLVDVQQSIIVRSEKNLPTIIAFGFNDDEAIIVTASLAPLAFSVSESLPLPVLEWRTFNLPDFCFDFTARKLITISRQAEHDTLVILAANATSLIFVDLSSGAVIHSLPFDCDSIIDIKYSFERRQLGLLLGSSLLIHEMSFPAQPHGAAITAETLTPSVLETMKVCDCFFLG
jgi:hypothetical protein